MSVHDVLARKSVHDVVALNKYSVATVARIVLVSRRANK